MLELRAATDQDIPAITAIYDHYVTHTAVSFEDQPPSVAEMTARMAKLHGLPYLVAVEQDTILGYAYAQPFASRTAYRHSVELTIYLAPTAKRHGIGRALYTALERELQAQGYANLYACIATPKVTPIISNEELLTRALSDTNHYPYISWDSVRFHHHLGFRMVGVFSQCGFKFDQFFDMVFMEKLIAPHEGMPRCFLPQKALK